MPLLPFLSVNECVCVCLVRLCDITEPNLFHFGFFSYSFRQFSDSVLWFGVDGLFCIIFHGKFSNRFPLWLEHWTTNGFFPRNERKKKIYRKTCLLWHLLSQNNVGWVTRASKQKSNWFSFTSIVSQCFTINSTKIEAGFRVYVCLHVKRMEPWKLISY